jgi:hypothetical protein
MNRKFYSSQRHRRDFKKICPNLKLKGETFDAAHLSQFVVEDQVRKQRIIILEHNGL